MVTGHKGNKERPREARVLTVRVPGEIHEGLRTMAFATGTSINDLVLRALRDYMADAGRREEVAAYIREAQQQFRVALDKLKDL